jgi:hypothetical protein
MKHNLAKMLRGIANPYKSFNSKSFSDDQFIGRNKEVEIINNLIDDFSETGTFSKNILITGERSIGKTTLLEYYRRILSNNFATYPIELSRYETKTIEDFFIELVDYFIRQYDGESDSISGFLDSEQITIWRTIKFKGSDPNSTFATRELNIINSIESNQEFQYQSLVTDVAHIINTLQSSHYELGGLIILIDEFQEFQKNPRLLEVLLSLSNSISNLLIVGAGLKSIYDNFTIFEKFSRDSIPLNLERYSDKDEIREAVFSPIRRKTHCYDHELILLFSPKCLHELEKRTNGNPYHINIICISMYEYFKNNEDAKHFEINRDVMDVVMNTYSLLSTNSKRIKNSIEACTSDQITSFGWLYLYIGLSIRQIILFLHSFNNINDEDEAILLSKIMENFECIKDLELFQILDVDNRIVSWKEFITLTPTTSAQYRYVFIGDHIDSLYASYIYESLTSKQLITNSHQTFEDLLTLRLGDELSKAVILKEIEKSDASKQLVPLRSLTPDDIWANYRDDIKIIEKYSDKDYLDEKSLDVVKSLTNKYELKFPALIGNSFDFSGYYTVSIKVMVRGKRRFVTNFFPVESSQELKMISKRITKYTDYFQGPLEEYGLDVKNIDVNYLPKTVMVLIVGINTNDLESKMRKAIKEREFSTACNLGKSICENNLKVDKGKLWTRIGHINNYSFCLICIGGIKKSKENLRQIIDKSMIANLNYSFALAIGGDIDSAIKHLKKSVNKLKKSQQEAQFLHVYIPHEKLKLENKIVEQVSLINVCYWNLLMFFASNRHRDPQTDSVIQKYSNAGVYNTENQKSINQRMNSWVQYYYYADLEGALKCANKLILKTEDGSYLHNDILNDISIFKSELNL